MPPTFAFPETVAEARRLIPELAAQVVVEDQIGEVRVIGGGARSPLWRGLQAAIFGRPVAPMRVEEGPAYGAALLAAVGAGLYSDVAAAVLAAVRTGDPIDPDPAAIRLYDDLYGLYRPLYGALKETFAGLAGFEQAGVGREA